MTDALVNPVTGDYSLVHGTPVRDPAGGLANAIYIRLMTPLGSYWADATLGSRLGELQRLKDVAKNGVLAVQYAQQALQPILDDGRAASIVITMDQPHDGRLYLQVEVTQANGQRFMFSHPVEVY